MRRSTRIHPNVRGDFWFGLRRATNFEHRSSLVYSRGMFERSSHRLPAWMLLLMLAGASCASVQTKCLQQPPSSKISDQALGVCQEALSETPDRVDVFQQTMLLLTLRGKHDLVVRQCSVVLSRDRSRSDARYYLAVALRRLNRCTEAIEHYRQYAAERPEDPDPHFALGLCHEQVGDVAAAQQAYGQYLAKEHRSTHQIWRGHAQQRSAALAKGVVTAWPQGGSQARLPADRGPAGDVTAPAAAQPAVPTPVPAKPQPVDCRAHQKAVEADPFATQAYERLAACLAAEKDHPKALRFMRIAVRDNPDYPRGWLHMGRAQRALGRQAEAKASLAKACQAKEIKTVVFDRNGYVFHGRIKALADAARKTGLEF